MFKAQCPPKLANLYQLFYYVTPPVTFQEKKCQSSVSVGFVN